MKKCTFLEDYRQARQEERENISQDLKRTVDNKIAISIIVVLLLVIISALIGIHFNNDKKVEVASIDETENYEKEALSTTYSVYATRTINQGKSKGDVDGDGFITKHDADLIIESIINNIDVSVGDIDNDGNIDAADAGLVSRAIQDGSYNNDIPDLQPYEVCVGETITFNIWDDSEKQDVTDSNYKLKYKKSDNELHECLQNHQITFDTVGTYTICVDEQEALKVEVTNPNEIYSTRKNTRHLKGDSNGDGFVTLYDANLILAHVINEDIEIDTDAADVNDDNAVNASDAGLIIAAISNGKQANIQSIQPYPVFVGDSLTFKLESGKNASFTANGVISAASTGNNEITVQANSVGKGKILVNNKEALQIEVINRPEAIVKSFNVNNINGQIILTGIISLDYSNNIQYQFSQNPNLESTEGEWLTYIADNQDSVITTVSKTLSNEADNGEWYLYVKNSEGKVVHSDAVTVQIDKTIPPTDTVIPGGIEDNQTSPETEPIDPDEQTKEYNINASKVVWENEWASTTLRVKEEHKNNYKIEYKVNKTTTEWTRQQDGEEEVKVDNLKDGDIIYARLTNGTNYGAYIAYIIKDKVAPSEPSIEIITGKTKENVYISYVTMQIMQGKDEESGTKCTKYKINDEEEKEITKNEKIKITEDGTYNITVYTIDKVGNKSKEINKTITIKIKDGQWLDTEKYTINDRDKMITGISPETTLEEFKQNISTDLKYEIKDQNGEELQDQSGEELQEVQKEINDQNEEELKEENEEPVYITTGMIVDVEDGSTYKIVVKGDINKDGKADILDLSILKKYQIEMIELDEIEQKAADVTDDEEIGIEDLSNLIKYIIGLIQL